MKATILENDQLLKNIPDLESLAQRINEQKIGWTAKAYSHLKGKTWSEIHSTLGHRNVHKRYHDLEPVIFQEKQQREISLAVAKMTTSYDGEAGSLKFSQPYPELNKDYSGDVAQRNLAQNSVNHLGAYFNWKEKLPRVRNQGSCGNCYLVACMAMLESRIRIHYDKEIDLSEQYVNDCNVYAQGCNGGYAYEVLRFLSEFWVPPKKCKPNLGFNGKCDNSFDCNLSDATFVSVQDYYYVGRVYGNDSEHEMMKEIKVNGPIVASFNPTQNFALYNSGIFMPEQDFINHAEFYQRVVNWVEVNHSILIYGWGEDYNGVKYWNVMNSWGDDWGEEGHFRILRGENTLGIEFMATAGFPIIINQQR